MKVSILGAGAVGSMLGGLIKRHDPDIDMHFIARGPFGKALERAGQVVLKGFWGTASVPVRVSSDVEDIAGSDYVFVTVKSQVTEKVMRQAAPGLGNALVISIQNGINQDVLAKFVPPERLLVGITATNIAVLEPGLVSLRRNGVTVIGPARPEVPPAATAAALDLLRKSGLPVRGSSDILAVQYNKLLVNSMGYASVLSNSDVVLEGVLDRAWRRAVAMPILSEGLATLARAGIRVKPIGGTSDVFCLRRLFRLFRIPPVDRLVKLAIGRLLKPERVVYSVYQDLVRGRKTEIEFVNGQIVRLARSLGCEAPYNALVVAMVHELEARGDGTFFAREEVLSRFRKVAEGIEGV